MKEELQEKMFNWLSQAAEKVGSFAESEVPQFVNDYLRWKLTEEWVFLSCWALPALALFVAAFYVKRFYRFCEKWNDGLPSYDKWFPCIVFWVSCALWLLAQIICVAKLSGHVMTLLQIHIAPKIYLMEQASQFWKK